MGWWHQITNVGLSECEVMDDIYGTYTWLQGSRVFALRGALIVIRPGRLKALDL